MMKHYIVVALLLMFGVCEVSATDNLRITYIETYKELAIKESLRSNIPVSIILAQGMLESQSGTSELAMYSSNHFGIKCKSSWRGNTYYKEDDDRDINGNLVASCFRAYTNVEASYIDHSNFLMQRERYRQLFTLQRSDYVNWAIGLQACGYATNQSYAIKLIDFIEKYQLNRFDVLHHSPFVQVQRPINPPQPQQAAIVQTVPAPRPVAPPVVVTPTPAPPAATIVQKETIHMPSAVRLDENYKRGQHDNMIERAVPNTYLKENNPTNGENYTHHKTKDLSAHEVTSSKYSNTMRNVYEKRLTRLTYVPKASNARR